MDKLLGITLVTRFAVGLVLGVLPRFPYMCGVGCLLHMVISKVDNRGGSMGRVSGR